MKELDSNGTENHSDSLLMLCKKEKWNYILKSFPDNYKKWNFDECDRKGNTPLLICAEKGNLLIIQEIYSWLPTIKKQQKNNIGQSSLFLAVLGEHLELVKWLLRNGSTIHERDIYNTSCLLIPSAKGKIDLIKCILDNTTSSDYPARNEYRSLIAAATNGHLDVVKYLVSKGCSLNEKNHQFNCLAAAIESGTIDVVKWIMDNGYTFENVTDKKNSLFNACKKGNLKMIQYFVKKGCSLTDTDVHNRTCMFYLLKDIDALEWLFDNGCPIDTKDNSGYTPILWASRRGFLPAVKWLYSKGASLKDKTPNFDTCLLLASQYGYLDLVQWLVEQGCLLKEPNTKGTAIMNAASNKHIDIIIWMLSNGSNIEENYKLDSDGNIREASKSCEEILKYRLIYDKVKSLHTTKSSRK